MSSICQVGVVTFENGREVGAEARLVDPQDYFDSYNTFIHGIDESRVRGSPQFSEVCDWLRETTAGEIVACHTHFDRVAITQACAENEIDGLPCTWLDTARVTRRAWSQFAHAGYGLANVALHFGIKFQHHDALHDARTAGLILLRAIEETGVGLDEWIKRCSGSASVGSGSNLRRTGDGDGPLIGENIVFTGALEIPRRDAADMAHTAGAAVEPNVTKGTTMLVVGDQDIEKLAGHTKSSKHRKAENLIASGQFIRIVGERDFRMMCQE
jgi:DNA polymerase III subunit epsilon